MNRLAFVSIVFLGTCLIAPSVHAEAPMLAGEPVVAIGKIKSLEAIKDNVDLVGSWIGQPDLWQMKDFVLKGENGGAEVDLSSIASDKPIGFVATASQRFVAFVPTADSAAFLAIAEKMSDGKKSIGKRTWRFDKSASPGAEAEQAFIRDNGSFVLVASDLKSLNSFDKPLALELKALDSPLLLTTRVFVDGIPAPLRNMALAALERNVQPTPPPGQKPEVTRSRQATRIEQRKRLRDLIQDLDVITVFAGLSPEDGVLLEVDLTGKPNSVLSRLPQHAPKQTRFGGFRRPDASFSLEAHTAASEPLALLFEDAKFNVVRNSLTDAEPQLTALFAEAANTFRTVGVDFVSSGHVWPKNKEAMVFAVALSDTSVPEQVLQDGIASATDGVKWSTTKLQDGTRCYEFVNENFNPSDESHHEPRAGVIAFSDTAAFAAIGNAEDSDPKADLVAAIQESKNMAKGDQALPFLSTDFAFADSVKRMMTEMGGGASKNPLLEQVTDGSTLTGISVLPVENGVKLRVKVGQGVLRSITAITAIGAKARQRERFRGVPLSSNR